MLTKALQGAALATQPAYIEDIFSAYLYSGTTDTSRTITNGIDLAGKGGMVWTKCRGIAYPNWIFDTARGVNKVLVTSTTAAEATKNSSTGTSLTAFNADGYNLVDQSGVPADNGTLYYGSSTYASWTFRKQAKFFDVVTFTTASSGSNVINHSLNSLPGCIIVKTTGITQDWYVWHRSLASNEYLVLNTTAAKASGVPTISVSSTQVTFGSGWLSTSTAYVAYLFAHDAGGFGASGTGNVISCGSFTTDSSQNATINLGYEPQLVLLKSSTTATNWTIRDVMRGLDVSTNGQSLLPNTSGAEVAATVGVKPTATGFTVNGANVTDTWIYIAIRRGPMRTPTSGTSVFEPVSYTGDNTNNRTVGSLYVPDVGFDFQTSGVTDTYSGVFFDRLRGPSNLLLAGRTDAEYANTVTNNFPMNGASISYSSSQQTNASGRTYGLELFKRAPGFFDEVCYTGTGANRTINHNLGVAPELWIVKGRSGATAWAVGSNSLANTEYLVLNTTAAKATGATYWNSTYPTSTVFSVGTAADVNTSSATYVAYLFATVAGVSKVGSYTGNGSSQTINCGFAAGARFVLIKRTNSTGNWYIWDTARGIVSANDPWYAINSGVNGTSDDSVDADSSGFIVNQNTTTDVNVTSATYIFLAVS